MESTNYIKLCGSITEKPQKEFTEGNRTFYKTHISVNRNSGISDIIPVILDSDSYITGDTVMLHGRICTKNTEGHLVLGCKAQTIAKVNGKVEHSNNVELDGHICTKPYYRNLGNREITNIILAVNSGNHSYYIPVIVWGYDSRKVSQMAIGEHLSITGRLQSRRYIGSDYEQHTTYEVSAIKLDV